MKKTKTIILDMIYQNLLCFQHMIHLFGAFMGFMKAVLWTEIIYPTFASNINLELYKKDKVYYVDYYIND